MLEFYTIAIIGILGAMSPGPDFIVVSKMQLHIPEWLAVLPLLVLLREFWRIVVIVFSGWR